LTDEQEKGKQAKSPNNPYPEESPSLIMYAEETYNPNKAPREKNRPEPKE